MRKSSGVLSCALAALASATACQGHSPAVQPAAHAQPTSGVGSVLRTPPGVTVGVIRKSGDITVYRVGHDRHARRIEILHAPHPGEKASSLSFTAGSQPRACATWVRYDDVDEPQSPSTLVCYQIGGSSQGVVLGRVSDEPIAVALSRDGREIAWIDYVRRYHETDVDFGAFSGDRVTGVRRVLPGPGMQCNPCLEGVNALAWAGDNALVLSREGQDDEGAGLGRLPLDERHIKRGWLDGPTTISAWKTDQPYDYFDDVVSADGHSALAIERPSENGPPPRGIRWRAVLVDFATGRRSSILATALPGRNVDAVSGGLAGLLYRTVSGYDADPRFYLRLPGDTVGQLITGLPHEATDAVAQPS